MRLEWGKTTVVSLGDPGHVDKTGGGSLDTGDLVASEKAFCHGVLQEWVSVGRGWYACACCGVERKLVGTRRLVGRDGVWELG